MQFNKLAIFAATVASVYATSGRYSTPSCYEFDVSWVNSTIDDLIFPVGDASECQKLCKDSVNCTAWTWTTHNNLEIKDACTLFNSTGDQKYFPETVSGPRSCVCSENAACSATEDNIIRVEQNIDIEETCQELCYNTSGCSFYTWYDSSEFLAHICILLTECDDQTSECSGCHSGPADCNADPQDELVIVVNGGEPSPMATISAEALYLNGTQLCPLPNLPNERLFHSMIGHTICGGLETSIRKSCIKFQNGNWEEYPWKLQEERADHITWRRADGKLMLLGGRYSPGTTEIVSETGSEAGFSLRYDTMYACSIKLEYEVIVTGGFDGTYLTRQTVSVYTEEGWVQDLASLRHGRYNHACAHYTSDNDLKFIVAGGYDGTTLTSTEIYSTSSMQWDYGASLPQATRFYSNGISVNNDVFFLGGRKEEIYSDVVKLNKENGSWIKVGEMSMPRVGHASSVMPLKDVLPFCVPGRQFKDGDSKFDVLPDEDFLTDAN